MSTIGRWSHLHPLQLSDFAQHLVKTELARNGFDVSTAEPADTGIDVVVRRDAGHAFDIQVKAVYKDNSVSFRKATFDPRDNLLAAVVLLSDDLPTEVLLIPSAAWPDPSHGLLSHADEQRKNQPEWGILLSPRHRDYLSKTFALSRVAARIRDGAPLSTQSLEKTAGDAADPSRATLWTGSHRTHATPSSWSRFLGCMLGGAVGDALGAPVEFMSHKAIVERFGTHGIRDFAEAYGGLGTITDDTQMTLFTAEGLLRGWVRGCLKGLTSYAAVTAHAYQRWLATQGETERGDGHHRDEHDGWLFSQAALHHRRAPGQTCVSALRAMQRWGDAAKNDSKGCGGVMRVAPVGLFTWRLGDSVAAEETFSLAAELAGLTHGHPTAQLASGTLALMIRHLLDGLPLAQALELALAVLRRQPHHEETLRALEMAQSLAATQQPHQLAIARLGQGWVAEEALAIAVYCSLVARDFEDGVVLAANHDGDSDSTGSIAGSLLGALYGYEAIAPRWISQLELREVIEAIANDLHHFPDWPLSEYSPHESYAAIWDRYPGH